MLFVCTCRLCRLVVVPDIVGSSANLTEEKISEKCFELIFAIDEVTVDVSKYCMHDSHLCLSVIVIVVVVVVVVCCR